MCVCSCMLDIFYDGFFIKVLSLHEKQRTQARSYSNSYIQSYVQFCFVLHHHILPLTNESKYSGVTAVQHKGVRATLALPTPSSSGSSILIRMSFPKGYHCSFVDLFLSSSGRTVLTDRRASLTSQTCVKDWSSLFFQEKRKEKNKKGEKKKRKTKRGKKGKGKEKGSKEKWSKA